MAFMTAENRPSTENGKGAALWMLFTFGPLLLQQGLPQLAQPLLMVSIGSFAFGVGYTFYDSFKKRKTK